MAHDLDINHICSKVSSGDIVSIGVDSIREQDKIIYNLSVIVRVQGSKASLIWTKDIEDNITDDLDEFNNTHKNILLSLIYIKYLCTQGE